MATKAAQILIVEDNAEIAAEYAMQLRHAGFEVQCTQSSVTARSTIDGHWDAILIQLVLTATDGLALLDDAVRRGNRAAVIALDSDGALDRAITAMRRGAYDFRVQPIGRERLIEACTRAVAETCRRRAVPTGRRASDRTVFHGFIGGSVPMQRVYRAIDCVARSAATVFITGESGTGKEVAAEALHRASDRAAKPFVAINCGAIPENLLESEIFGHVRGAFTGATDHRIGAAKVADGGTLFLDEICELELKLQVKLLRFLQTGTIQRVGTSTSEKVDVRVVCATNRDPHVEVAEGRFREDLFYRLAVVPLDLPPLRERGRDVDLIAETFLARFTALEHKTVAGFGEAALAWMRQHNWPGNVRELQNAVRRAVILADTEGLIEPHHLQPPFPGLRIGRGSPPETTDGSGPLTLDMIERQAIERAVARADGSFTAAARELGVSASTLYRKHERWQGNRAA